jgi:molybdate transport system substrate-binding protein
MNFHTARLLLSGLAILGLLTQSNNSHAAELKIFASRAVATVLQQVGPEFERTTGNKLNLITGLSPEFVKRINEGEKFDIIAAPPPSLDGLMKSGKLLANSRANLVRSGVGVEVRKGAKKPDISSVDAFKRALLNAKSIGFLPVGGVPELMQRLGIADAIKSKTTVPHSDIVSELVAKGELDLGVVGPLPPDIQIYTVFAVAVSAESKAPDQARALINFLSGPKAAPVIKSQGMEPA